MNLIILNADELKSVLKNVLADFEKEKELKRLPKLFTINQVAKMLGRSHSTIKKHVKEGIIPITRTGQITEEAINIYLNR